MNIVLASHLMGDIVSVTRKGLLREGSRSWTSMDYYYSLLSICIVLCFIVVRSHRLMPPDALQPKAYCTNPGL